MQFFFSHFSLLTGKILSKLYETLRKYDKSVEINVLRFKTHTFNSQRATDIFTKYFLTAYPAVIVKYFF